MQPEAPGWAAPSCIPTRVSDRGVSARQAWPRRTIRARIPAHSIAVSRTTGDRGPARLGPSAFSLSLCEVPPSIRCSHVSAALRSGP